MKTKFLLGILLITILLAMTVSAIDFTVTQPERFSQELSSVTFQVTNSNATNSLEVIVPSSLDITGESGYKATFTITGNTTIAAGKTETFTLTHPSVIDSTKFKLGKIYSSLFDVKENDANKHSVTLEFIRGFCTGGNTGTQAGKLEITGLDDRTIDNEDEWTWHPLDNVEFKVEVTNNFDADKRVKIEYELYDDAGGKLDLGSTTQEQSVSVNSNGGTKTVTFTLRVPADADEKTYRMLIKAYVKSNEKEGCVDKSSSLDNNYYHEVRIEKIDARAVIVDMDKIELSKDSFNCGDTASLIARIYNVGDEDEEKVKVRLFNKELGIDISDEVSNLDKGDSADITFDFTIQEKVIGKNYLLELITLYEYDEDTDEPGSNSKEDLDKNFLVPLKVNCIIEEEKKAGVSVTAELESDAIAGEQFVVKGTLKNTGTEETMYSLSLTGYDSWASLDKIEPKAITLKADESKEFKIYLNVNEDSTGEQTFKIKASYNGEATEREVSVELAEKEVIGTTGITGSVIAENLRKNWFIWVIVVVNVILIIAIIAVARKIAGSR